MIYFAPKGSMKMSAADGKFRDSGTWKVEDSTLCYTWKNPKTGDDCEKVFVLPDGSVFMAGHSLAVSNGTTETWYLDVASGDWSQGPGRNFKGASGSAVMYEPGKMLHAGGLEDNPIIEIPPPPPHRA